MDLLISADELERRLGDQDRPLLLDVRWTLSADPAAASRRDDYLAGHLPGARFVDLETELVDHAAVGQGRHPLPRAEVFQTAMRAVGVDEGREVVIYDGGSGLGAARLWWLLTDAGFEDARVLNGGYAAWIAAGLDVEGGEPAAATPTEWTARPGRRMRARMGDLPALQRAGARVIDVRAAERFRGEVEPLDPVAGHIPGAVNVPIAQVQHPDGRIRDAREVLERFAARPGDVFTCGSGITASLALLAYEASGGQGAMIYPGSWSQWSTAGGPVETGSPTPRS